jgi:protein AATF/BFR2
MPCFSKDENIRDGQRGLTNDLKQIIGQLLMIKENYAEEFSDGSMKKRKHRTTDDISELWVSIQELDSKLEPFLHEKLEKWWNKTHFNSHEILQKKFKAINQGYKAQVDYALKDSDILVQRTKLLRSNITLIQLPVMNNETQKVPNADEHLQKIYPEIYDDSDCYQSLLRDLIDAKMTDASTVHLPISMGILFAFW